jgi:hypothetical protein
MLLSFLSRSYREMLAKLKALDASQAIIEFKLDGTIILGRRQHQQERQRDCSRLARRRSVDMRGQGGLAPPRQLRYRTTAGDVPARAGL